MSKSKIYLKNEDLYLQIIESKKQDELTREAQRMLLLLTERVSRGFPYENPEDKKDCVAFAHLDLFKYWKRFDPEKSKNAFAYYTSIIRRGLFKGWNQLHPKKYKGTLRIDGGYGENSDGIYSFK